MDDFGDRMKAYEAIETGRTIGAQHPVCVRIDGRAFSTFTRGMRRPFDERMSAAMINTAKRLVEKTLPRIAYTQSDEISLIYLGAEGAEPMFGGKQHKITSVLASMAASAFQVEIRRAFGEAGNDMAERLPHFDARTFELPSVSEAANVILWRAMDARKNAVSMATRAHYSTKAMHGKDQSDMRSMLAAANVDFEAYPVHFKRGTFLRRILVERLLSTAEIERIPEKHRPPPYAVVTRTTVAEIDMPSFETVTNRVAVIFDGAVPLQT